MKMSKKGQTFEQIILFILALLVLVLVVMFFTGTFGKLQSFTNVAGGKVECASLCAAGNQTGYTVSGCDATLGKSFADCKSASLS